MVDLKLTPENKIKLIELSKNSADLLIPDDTAFTAEKYVEAMDTVMKKMMELFRREE